MDLLPGYLQIWDAAQQTLGSVSRMMEIDLPDMELPDPAQHEATICAMEKIDLLTEQLTQIKSALEAQDLVLLGDILEYEFGPLTDDWQNMLNSLAEKFDEQKTACTGNA